MAQRFLALETGFARYSLAALESTTEVPSRLIESWVAPADRKASTYLHTDIAQLLARRGWGVEGLYGLVVNPGPGSFTGLRVGIACANGLARARPLTLLAGDPMTALAYEAQANAGQPNITGIVVVVDSRKGEVTAQRFRAAQPGVAPQPIEPWICLTPGALTARWPNLAESGRWIIVGDGAARYAEAWRAGWGEAVEVHAAPQKPDAGIMGSVALVAWRGGALKPTASGIFMPRYARPSEVEFRT